MVEKLDRVGNSPKIGGFQDRIILRSIIHNIDKGFLFFEVCLKYIQGRLRKSDIKNSIPCQSMVGAIFYSSSFYNKKQQFKQDYLSPQNFVFC